MRILNRHHLKSGWPDGAIYVGRGTPLGNPFVIGEHGTRDEVIDAYEHYLRGKIEQRDPAILTALAGLSAESSLVCSCAPARCHAEVIAKAWNESMSCARRRHVFHEDGSIPKGGEAFVFGSNLAGRHGAGAALVAKERFGAMLGVGAGYMGDSPAHCYAIPTKNDRLAILPLEQIARHVSQFLAFAKAHPDMRFFVSRVGCGLAGYKDKDIAPMFAGATPGQCSFAKEWRPYLEPPSMTYAGIGSRKTPPAVLHTMKRIAERLEDRGYTLRSGGADGADKAFESGCLRKEIFLPWPGFNGNDSSLNSPSAKASEVAAAVHPVFSRLSDAAKKLMARNSHQILGADLRSPVDFVVCWTPDGAESERERTPETGGTGQAIALASRWGIPVFNLARPDALQRIGMFIANNGGPNGQNGHV